MSDVTHAPAASVSSISPHSPTAFAHESKSEEVSAQRPPLSDAEKLARKRERDRKRSKEKYRPTGNPVGRPPKNASRAASGERPVGTPTGARSTASGVHNAPATPAAGGRTRTDSPFDGAPPPNPGAQAKTESGQGSTQSEGTTPVDVGIIIDPAQLADILLAVTAQALPLLGRAVRYPEHIAANLALNKGEQQVLKPPLVLVLKEAAVEMTPSAALALTAAMIVGTKLILCERQFRAEMQPEKDV